MSDGDAGYATLFWMAYKNETTHANDVPAQAEQPAQSDPYPYLAWARDHFSNSTGVMLNSGIYPLSSEASASKANYSGMDIVDPVYKAASLSVLHGWHGTYGNFDIVSDIYHHFSLYAQPTRAV